MPLNDRDYMRPSSARRGSWRVGSFDSFASNPIYVLVAVNLVFYLATLINPKLIDILGFAPSLLAGRPWTIVTNMFVHAGFAHIFGNMIVLFFFGRVVYKLMGGWRFLVVYFCGGLAGNLFYYWLGDPTIVAVGASAAVYALAGALVVLVPNMRVTLWFIIPMPLWVFVLIFLGILSFPPFSGYDIAWQAHLGGIVVGLVAGFIFKRQMRYVIYR